MFLLNGRMACLEEDGMEFQGAQEPTYHHQAPMPMVFLPPFLCAYLPIHPHSTGP